MYPEISIGSFEIESYTVCYLLAFGIVTVLLRSEFKRRLYSLKLFIGFFITGLFFGLLGSKIYYVIENWEAFTIDPNHIIFTISGSAWFGGFILGGSAILIFLRINKLPILKFLDMLAPIIPLGQVFGRLGCFLAGCCYGTPSDGPWAVLFPNTIYPPQVRVHPTQLYEMIISLMIFMLLQRLKNKNLKGGILIGLYLVLAGIGRLFIEFYRINPKIIAQLSAPQLFSVLSILLGLFFVLKSNESNKIVTEISQGLH
jgi:phosphatidylglycerol:prolipoprotein diacylglycerol transferase